MNNIEARIAAYSIAWEGCLSLSLAHHKRRGKVFPEFIPSVSIAGTDRALLESFCELTGYGKLRRERRRNSLANQKEVYCWVVTGGMSQIKSFCEEILPYLPAKKEQAEFLICFCSRKRFSRYNFTDYAFYYKMKELNRRGL